jgi:four helix bundle protein
MRRASKSIPANIAEGFSRRVTARDFKLYLAHALGSANEMVVHLLVAVELNYATAAGVDPLMNEHRILARQIAKMIQVWRDPRERGLPQRSMSSSDHRPPSPISD